MAHDPILDLQQVTRIFTSAGGHPHTVLRKVNFALSQGEFVVVIGPSGCGKSTMLNLIAGFDKPTAGTVRVNNVPVTGPGPDKAMVFQDYALLPWMNARENVEIGLKLKGLRRAERRRIAVHYLALVGLGASTEQAVYKMSGGMQQRVSIARALALEPSVLLMDEPFGALDALQRAVMHGELTRIWQETHASVVFVTHSLDEAIFLADRVVAMTTQACGISGELRIGLPRPRDSLAPEFTELKRRLLDMLELDEAARASAA